MKTEFFIIPKSNNDEFMIYAPLKRALFSVDLDMKNLVEDYIFRSKPIPKEFSKLRNNIQLIEEKENTLLGDKNDTINKSHIVILLSEKCNLNCSYCYSQEGRSKIVLKQEYIKAIVDNGISSTSEGKLEVTFLGGGDPTYTWELLVWSVKYIKQRAAEKNISTRIGIATNMTLLNEDRVQFIKDNNIIVSASYDILPDIQDSQRKFACSNSSTFSVVDKNIKLLMEHGVIPRIRSTITELNVQRMSEMIEFVAENYPRIEHVHLEHVSSSNKADTYYEDFIENYFEARDIAIRKNIKLSNSIIKSTQYIRNVFCSGEFCITPVGDIVSCHRISNRNDKFYNFVNYGCVDDEITINNTKLKKVKKQIYSIPEKCDTCFAKYHCAGGCPYNRYTLSENDFSKYCKFTQSMMAMYFEKVLQK